MSRHRRRPASSHSVRNHQPHGRVQYGHPAGRDADVVLSHGASVGSYAALHQLELRQQELIRKQQQQLARARRDRSSSDADMHTPAAIPRRAVAARPRPSSSTASSSKPSNNGTRASSARHTQSSRAKTKPSTRRGRTSSTARKGSTNRNQKTKKKKKKARKKNSSSGSGPPLPHPTTTNLTAPASDHSDTESLLEFQRLEKVVSQGDARAKYRVNGSTQLSTPPSSAGVHLSSPSGAMYTSVSRERSPQLRANPPFDRSMSYRKFTNHYIDPDDVIRETTKQLYADPTSSGARMLRAAAYIKKSNSEHTSSKLLVLANAIADYSRVILREGNVMDVFYLRGRAYQRLGQIEKAIADFTQALQFNPDHHNAQYARAACQNIMGNFDQAISDYESALLKDNMSSPLSVPRSTGASQRPFLTSQSLRSLNISAPLSYVRAWVGGNVAVQHLGQRAGPSTATLINGSTPNSAGRYGRSTPSNAQAMSAPSSPRHRGAQSMGDPSAVALTEAKRTSPPTTSLDLSLLATPPAASQPSAAPPSSNGTVMPTPSAPAQPGTANPVRARTGPPLPPRPASHGKKTSSTPAEHSAKAAGPAAVTGTVHSASASESGPRRVAMRATSSSSAASAVRQPSSGDDAVTARRPPAPLPSASTQQERKEENIDAARTADRWHAKGFAARRAGKFEEALQCYDRALAIQPNHFKATFNRSFALHSLGRYAEAIASYTHAIKLQPRNALAFYNRGIAYDKSGDFQGAIKDFTKALEFSPLSAKPTKAELSTHANFYHNRAFAYKKLSLFDEAIRDFSAAVRLDPTHFRATLNRGLVHEKLGDAAAASTDYERALSLRPNSISALQARASLREGQLQYLDAINDLTHAVSVAMKEFKSGVKARALTLSSILTSRGLLWQTLYDNLHAKSPDDKQNATYLSNANKDFTAALKFQSNNAAIHQHRGLVLAALGDFEAAVADYTSFLAVYPRSPAVLINRAFGLRKLQRLDDAISDYSDALRFKHELTAEEVTSVFNNRAYLYGKKRMFKEAVEDYSLVLQLDQQNSNALYNRAVCYLKLGQKELSQQDFALIKQLEANAREKT